MSDPATDPEAFYDELAEDEWRRLEKSFTNRMEFENTVAYLERDLPPGGRVLDAGGGAGRYTVWLAERGYDVTLVDRSRGQLSVATEKVRERGLDDRVEFVRGDLRGLPLSDREFDAVCCLGGPLSHLLDAADRARALEELHRVAAPGAPAFVSVMGRIAVMRNIARNVPELAWCLEKLAETGDYDREIAARIDDPEFTVCHFFRAEELREAVGVAGFDVETMVGLEGIVSTLQHGGTLDEVDEERLADLETVVRDTREDPTVVDVSDHMLAVARA